MIMKKYFLLSVGLLMGMVVWAQADDVYFVPKKSTKTKTSKETYYVGSDRDVDEYNRRGNYLVSAVEPLEEDDVIEFDAVRGEFPDTVYVDDPYYDEYAEDDDYRYTRELYRWYDPWYYGWGWPYYRGWWRWGWYDPWYAGYWGWYDPWYWGWSWSWWPYYGWGGWHRGHHGWLAGGRGIGYSNRGRGHAGATIAGARGRRGGNAYNDIARRSDTKSSRRSANNYRSYGNSSRNYSSSRSYSPSYSTRSSGGFGGGGSRGGGFGGGGSRGGGGGHGGRR